MGVTTEDPIMTFVERELHEDPDQTTTELYEKALERFDDLEEMGVRSFHARYPLQVKRRARMNGSAPTAQRRRRAAPPAMPKSVFADKPLERGQERRADGEPVSVFSAAASEMWTVYECEVSFISTVFGGTPGDPKVIEGWLRKKAGLTDSEDEIAFAVQRVLRDIGEELPEDIDLHDIAKISERVAGQSNTNRFRRDPDLGLYFESRCVKAGIKESTNALFAGKDFRVGPTRKGAKSFVSEHVFVEPEIIPFGRQEPDGIELMIGHVSGPQGKRSTLTYHEVVEKGVIRFQVLFDKVAKEHLIDDPDGVNMADIWMHMERNGLGAVRSQGHGQFRVTRWEEVR